MDNTRDITVLSLCSGYGGFELGLSRVLSRSLRVVAVEIEAFAAAHLVAKAETGELAIEALYPDVCTFPAARFRGCFDFVVAGYPCTPFSLAGSQTGEDHQSYIWPAIARIIDKVQPEFVLLENVPNHLHQGFDKVAADLEEMGFLIALGLYSAAETGASIRSRRLFVLAQAVCDGHWRTQTALYSGRQKSVNSLPRTGPPGPNDVRKIPRMADDGPNRVDRLRLLGNGIVPQQAEKAIRCLMTLFER